MKLKVLSSLCFLSLIVVGTACSGGSDADQASADQPAKKEIKKPSGNASVLKVGDKLFNVPSPLETAFLIEKVGGTFNEDILSANTNANQFSTKQEQALNLGIYGADLGYSLIHDQSQQAFTYLATCKKLGTELGISPALYAELMKRFEGNMENKDSLLIFISELNRLSDQYLKENQSEGISALILAGGWVESLYFATELQRVTGNEKLRTRIAEQKNTLENLIGLLKQQTPSDDLGKLIARFEDLKLSYAQVTSTYEYADPEVKTEQRMTVIKSKTTVEMSDATLQEISEKITTLRNDITGNSNA